MRGNRSEIGIVQSAIDVKTWLARMPSADEVRPGRCPLCGAASRCPGEPLALWGHGVRDRLVQGPLEPGVEPTATVIAVRRYLCRPCGAVLVVVPRGIVPGRRYAAAAIAWALARFGIERKPADEVRRWTSPDRAVGFDAHGRWTALRRWVRAVSAGALFPRARIRRTPAGWSLRRIAARIAETLAGHAPPSVRHLSLAAQAFYGGVRMA